jgi:hypothetical protein
MTHNDRDRDVDPAKRRPDNLAKRLRDYLRVSSLRKLSKDSPRILSVPIGLALVIGGIFGFLPIVGFWMLPLGLAILAAHSPLAARLFGKMRRAMAHIRQVYRNHERRR